MEFDGALSRAEAEARAIEEWIVRFKNGAEARLIQQPATTLVEVLRRYPGIGEAWPMVVGVRR